MNNAPMIELGNITRITSGGTPSRSKPEFYKNGTIPWVKTGDLKTKYIENVDEYITEVALLNSSAKLFPVKTVLVALYGATIGACGILTRESATNQACGAILPCNDVYPEYLYYYLKYSKPKLIAKGVGGAQPNISGQILKNFPIPLLPLPEQKRIAAILDQAHDLKEKRKQAIAKLDQLVQSVFIDMFGDPVENPKGWEQVPFGDCILDIIGGQSIGGENGRASDQEWAVLKISSVTSGVFIPTECKRIPIEQLPKNKVEPKVGDLLFSRANTRELVAAVALVEEPCTKLILPDKLWKIIPIKDVVNVYFLKYLLSNSVFKMYLTKNATGTSGSMLNISKAKLRGIKIIVPPIQLQREFQEIMQQIRKMHYKMVSQLKHHYDFINSLQQEFFG